MANFGLAFERAMVDKLTKEGWVAIRSAASKTVDVVAAKKGQRPMFLELKATRSKILNSYGNEVVAARKQSLQGGSPARFGFVIKLNRGKIVWLWLDTMTIDRKHTTFKDTKAIDAWCKRKVKRLKQEGLF